MELYSFRSISSFFNISFHSRNMYGRSGSLKLSLITKGGGRWGGGGVDGSGTTPYSHLLDCLLESQLLKFLVCSSH